MAAYFSSRRSIPHSPSAPAISFKSIGEEDEEPEGNLSCIDLKCDPREQSTHPRSTTLSVKASTPPVIRKSSTKSMSSASRSLSLEQGLALIDDNVFSPDSPTKERQPLAASLSSKLNYFNVEGVDSQDKVTNCIIITIAISILIFSLPLPSFLSGLVLGLSVTGSFSYCLVSILFPFLTASPNIQMKPSYIDKIGHQEDAILKHEGFINETRSYNPVAHKLSHLKSVYLKLEGTTIKLFRPSKPAPKKSSSFEILSPENYVLTHVRIYDLMGAKATLVPVRLSEKRKWSRKFPIKLKFMLEGVQGLTTSDEQLMTEEKKPCPPTTLYLFARTSREKEDWFFRLSVATGAIDKFQRGFKRVYSSSAPLNIETAVRVRNKSISSRRVSVEHSQCKYDMQYCSFMAAHKILTNTLQSQRNKSTENVDTNSLNFEWPFTSLNLLFARFLWDVSRQERWISFLANKIQAKLATIKVPYFIDAITLVGLDIGNSFPIFVKSRDTKMNEQGLWTSFEFQYNGGFNLTVETRLDLQKFVEVETSRTDVTLNSSRVSLDHAQLDASLSAPTSLGTNESPRSSLASLNHNVLEEETAECYIPELCNDEIEDSGESSDDGASELLSLLDQHHEESVSGGGGSHKDYSSDSGVSLSGSGGNSNTVSMQASASTSSLVSRHPRVLSAIERVAKSDTVKKLKEKQFVKNIINDISKTHIVLTVHVQCAQGAIIVNIPPPPTDRLWWGFESSTDIKLDVFPKLGEKMIKVNLICNLIGTKLTQEIKKVLFYPNLDDIPLGSFLQPPPGA